MLHALRLSLFVALLWTLPASAASPAEAALVAALREGGNVIVLRHGATHADQVDAKPFDPATFLAAGAHSCHCRRAEM